jgi:signal peptidase II
VVEGWARAIATLGVVVLLDQATKQAAVTSIGRGESTNVFLGLDLTNVRNKGVAFGFLSGGGAPLVVLTALALLLLLAYFARHANTPLLWLPVGLLLGGALGNLSDRARDGAVIDFIDPVAWPAFNLADAAIVLGVPTLLYVIEGVGRRGRAA